MNAITGQELRNLALASMGAMLEYYDFVVFVFVAAALSQAMFPPGTSEWLRLVQVFSIYAIGYLIKPVAGLVVAHFADRVGRKRLFIITILLMSVPTFLMGLLPSYAQAGAAAPVLLLALRILQGCAVSGELPSAAVFVTEHARPQRLFFASGALHGVIHCGLLLGSASAAVAALVASHTPGLPSLAWRLPFLVGGVFGLAAAYLRRHLDETPLFAKLRETKQVRRLPLRDVLLRCPQGCLVGLVLFLAQSITASVFLQFMSTYLITQFHMPGVVVFAAGIVCVLSFAAAMPLWGLCADRFGPSRTMAASAVAAAAVASWFFARLSSGEVSGAALTWSFVPIGITCSATIALNPGLLASLFPTDVRQTGYSLPYNFGSAFLSGPGPLVLAWSARNLSPMAPLGFFLVACAASLCGAVLITRVPRHLGTVTDDGPEMVGSPARSS